MSKNIAVLILALSAVALPCAAQQMPCPVTVSPTGRTFAANGAGLYGVVQVTASDDCTWEASASPSWLVLNNIPNYALRLTGSDSFFYTLEPNATQANRAGFIRVNNALIRIVQGAEGCTYSAPASVTVSRDGGTVRIPASTFSLCQWTAETPDAWAAVSGAAEFTGPGEVQINIQANPGFTRKTTITVAGQPVELVQPGLCAYSLSRIATAAPASGAFFELALTTEPGCAWTVTGVPPWVSVSPAAGSGPTNLQLSFAPNPGPYRSADVQIAGIRHNLAQVGSMSTSCTYTPSTTSVSVPAAGASGTFTLTTAGQMCSWALFAESPWLQAIPITGSVSGTIHYTVYPNFLPRPRTTSLFVAGVPVRIDQAANPGTEAERFVQMLYFNMFGRTPSAAETAFQVAALNGGLPRANLVLAFTNSEEFNRGSRFVAGLYVGILGRDAEYGGWLFQRNALLAGGVTQPGLVSNFLNSTEFSFRYPSPSDSEFVRLLYRQILLREPSQLEVNAQVAALLAGTTRTALTGAFLNAQEFRVGTGARLSAFLVYSTLLARAPTPAELALRAGQVQSGTPLAALTEAFMNTPEFLAQWQ